MKVVYFRLSQVTIPTLKNQSELSYYLIVHIGPTVVELPLIKDGTNYLKSKAVISFEYDSASNYCFDLTLSEEEQSSGQTEIASVEIPLRACPANKRIVDNIEMEIKDEHFFDNVTPTPKDSYEDNDSDEEEKSIIIFFEMHRSENKADRFKAHLGKMRNFNSDFFLSSKASFMSSYSFTGSLKNLSNKPTLAISQNEEIEKEPESRDELNLQTKDEDNHENEEIQLETNENEPNQEIIQIEQEKHQELSNPNQYSILEEEEELNELSENEHNAQNSTFYEKGGRQKIISSSDSEDYNNDVLSENEENKNDTPTDELDKFNILKDDEDDVHSVDQDTKNENPAFLNLSSGSTVYGVYPPKKKFDENEIEASIEQNQTENQLNENTESELDQQQEENIEPEQKVEDEKSTNESQGEDENILEADQSEPIENTFQQSQKEDENLYESDQSKPNIEDNSQNEAINNDNYYIPSSSVESNQFSQNNDQSENTQEESSMPAQQQPPILKFYSFNMQNFECLNEFSFYPSAEQVGSFYAPPPLLPITIRPPSYD